MSLPSESDIHDIKHTYIHTYLQPSIHIALLLPYLKSDYLTYCNPSCCPLDNRWPLADVCYNTPRELRGSISSKGGNKTQATVLYLLDRLPPAKYHVYLDNLFTSTTLIKVLRSHRYRATGTCRMNSGVISELVNIKKNNKGKDEQAWGTLISIPISSGLVNQCG